MLRSDDVGYSGGDDDILKLRRELDKDPRKHLRSKHDPDHLINKWNEHGQTPLYVATKNGHLKIIKFFIEEGANPHMKSYIKINSTEIEEESILDAAVRWRFTAIVNYLLTNFDWSKDEI